MTRFASAALALLVCTTANSAEERLKIGDSEASGLEWCAVEALLERDPAITFRRTEHGPLEFLGEAVSGEEVGALLLAIEECSAVARLVSIARQPSGRFAYTATVKARKAIAEPGNAGVL